MHLWCLQYDGKQYDCFVSKMRFSIIPIYADKRLILKPQAAYENATLRGYGACYKHASKIALPAASEESESCVNTCRLEILECTLLQLIPQQVGVTPLPATLQQHIYQCHACSAGPLIEVLYV